MTDAAINVNKSELFDRFSYQLLDDVFEDFDPVNYWGRPMSYFEFKERVQKFQTMWTKKGSLIWVNPDTLLVVRLTERKVD
jgi:hypothetical protein